MTAVASQAWSDARKRDDFAAFAPWLDRIFALAREEADAVLRRQKIEGAERALERKREALDARIEALRKEFAAEAEELHRGIDQAKGREQMLERDRRAMAESRWAGDEAIRGFHSVSLRLKDGGATEELLKFMGYEEVDKSGNIRRLAIKNGNGADVVDIESLPTAGFANLGAGSVHHVAFAVEDRAKQLEVRKALVDTGYGVTPVIDRDYFWAIYFRTPGGVLFEVSTNEPGFDRDEDTAHLGEALKLPTQHQHLRPYLEQHLQKLEG